jgi:uncharacterized protein YccT (UPF0319 family)
VLTRERCPRRQRSGGHGSVAVTTVAATIVTVTTSPEPHIDRLHTLVDLVEKIRRANRAHDHPRVETLKERLADALAASSEELLSTHELAHRRVKVDEAATNERLAAAALDELQAVVLAYGLSPSLH